MKWFTFGIGLFVRLGWAVNAFSLQIPFSLEDYVLNRENSDVTNPSENSIQDIISDRLAIKEFEVFELKSNPKYSLRVKENDPGKLGIDTVKQWTGYLDVDKNKHLFYWFFESRNDPENDPVILWLNGGPGCSSFNGMLFDLGPSSIGKDLKPIYNVNSWNNNASIIFLEQPIGVGFSYGDGVVDSTSLASIDVINFLQLFFEKFHHLTKNKFHIAGSSYAGHYIPRIAAEIVLQKESDEPLNFDLTSIILGNSYTDPKVQNNYYAPMACGKGGHEAVLTPEQCNYLDSATKNCEKLMNFCYMIPKAIPCVAATAFCEKSLLSSYRKTGLNFYDIRHKCENSNTEFCYNGLKYVEEYMNIPEVQYTVGSDVDHYDLCSDEIGSRFLLTGDISKPYVQHVSTLLDRGVNVLVYAGDKDFICNWLGNKAWSDNVGWIHTYKYRSLPLKPWINVITGKISGEVKSFGALTFLRVFDAGHMVSHDQPENSLYMINSWISGNYGLGYE